MSVKKYDNVKCDVSVKRFYLDLKINLECPHCGSEVEYDYSQQYLSYPSIGSWDVNYGYCDHCENEFDFKNKLTLALEVEEG